MSWSAKKRGGVPSLVHSAKADQLKTVDAKLVAYYMDVQKQYEDRLIRPEGVDESPKTRTA